MKHNRVLLLIGFIGLAALIFILNFTSPTEIGPFGVLLFFTTIYLVFFCMISCTMQAFYSLALKRKVFRKKDYLYAAVASFGSIMLLMLVSFGVFSLWTVILTVIFLSLVEFLVYKKIQM